MIHEGTKAILKALPDTVTLVAATKKRSVAEVDEAIRAGVRVIGENYVRDAEEKFKHIGRRVKWHLIGHLQSNKVQRAAKLFDMIETLDSPRLAEKLNEACGNLNKTMPVLIEVNCAQESQKSGIVPGDVRDFLENIVHLEHVKPMGLMTMGPVSDDPETARPFFRATKALFDELSTCYQGRLRWQYLSMGMSDTWQVAVQEGANMIRVGRALFGERSERSERNEDSHTF